MTKHIFHCDSCKRNLVHDNKLTTGYGIDPETKEKYCFACCGMMDMDAMAECKPGDKRMLYLIFDNDGAPSYAAKRNSARMENFPATLSYVVRSVYVGGHNWGIKRYDAYFQDHTGAWWWGVKYGDWTQICHCKKLKHAPV